MNNQNNLNQDNPDRNNDFLHVNSINRCVRERTKKSMYIYEDMLKKCFRRVKLAVDLGEKSCFYQLPEFILGKPSYNMTQCLKYMYDNIVKYGYYVKYLPPNIFFISWVHAYNTNYVPITNEHIVKTSYQQYVENTERTEEQERQLPQPTQHQYQQFKPLTNHYANQTGTYANQTGTYANQTGAYANTPNLNINALQPKRMLPDSKPPAPCRTQPQTATVSLIQPSQQSAIDTTQPNIFNVVPRSQSNASRPWNQHQHSDSKPEYKPLKFNPDMKNLFK